MVLSIIRIIFLYNIIRAKLTSILCPTAGNSLITGILNCERIAWGPIPDTIRSWGDWKVPAKTITSRFAVTILRIRRSRNLNTRRLLLSMEQNPLHPRPSINLQIIPFPGCWLGANVMIWWGVAYYFLLRYDRNLHLQTCHLDEGLM